MVSFYDTVRDVGYIAVCSASLCLTPQSRAELARRDWLQQRCLVNIDVAKHLGSIYFIFSTQLNRELRTQVSDTSKSTSWLYTIINEQYHFMTSSDRFLVFYFILFQRVSRSAIKWNEIKRNAKTLIWHLYLFIWHLFHIRYADGTAHVIDSWRLLSGQYLS